MKKEFQKDNLQFLSKTNKKKILLTFTSEKNTEINI